MNELVKRLRPRELLIRVPEHPLPSQLANSVDHRGGIRASVRQVPAVQNQVGGSVAQVGQHSFESRKIPVNIGDDRNAHARGTADYRSALRASSTVAFSESRGTVAIIG